MIWFLFSKTLAKLISFKNVKCVNIITSKNLMFQQTNLCLFFQIIFGWMKFFFETFFFPSQLLDDLWMLSGLSRQALALHPEVRDDLVLLCQLLGNVLHAHPVLLKSLKRKRKRQCRTRNKIVLFILVFYSADLFTSSFKLYLNFEEKRKISFKVM